MGFQREKGRSRQYCKRLGLWPEVFNKQIKTENPNDSDFVPEEHDNIETNPTDIRRSTRQIKAKKYDDYVTYMCSIISASPDIDKNVNVLSSNPSSVKEAFSRSNGSKQDFGYCTIISTTKPTHSIDGNLRLQLRSLPGTASKRTSQNSPRSSTSPLTPARAPEFGYDSSLPGTVDASVAISRRTTTHVETECGCMFCTNQRPIYPEAQDMPVINPREEWHP
ncbi:hypothetical protein JTB14_015964 [Gonioctena quinquepunctata]|nr:hypothetical protein JTB14_015964 [Gonioctena quinquepunctata]